ncbi:hypothetical protein Xen7305DRAFT_00013960 [Xenococcus sp. PCC 7305]|uniref:hypothetical protein n=1 Tax=Xenococcus sp. PCC 7305 TaxID=102125 RepID=UPI0002AD1255|nr:hypothetical protein [Xenococcus sp. PCC 7305]ELS01691.1 hypothetical protein Xen7305DRAFT_00013960 [Xenococcus sp. PCC 7305]
MSKFFSNIGNISRAIGEGFSEAATTGLATSQRQDEMSKLEVQKREVELKLEKNYTLIGQQVADTLRRAETVDQNLLQSLFSPIAKLDREKEEILAKIKEIKAKQADQLKAQALIRVKKEVENEIAKLKELRDLDVIDQTEFEVTQAKLNKPVVNFERLYNLKIAFERNLITQEEYIERKEVLDGSEKTDKKIGFD